MKILTAILDLLFPPRCVFCHKILEKGTNGEACPKCLRKLPKTKNGGRQKGDFFAYCLSPLYYEGDVRESIHRYKFEGMSAYSKTYGRLVAECIRENLDEEFDIITWPALSKKRLKKRGYDQAGLLAKAVAEEFYASAVSVLKKREVPAQSGVGDESKRRANIANAYTVPDADLVSGKTLLLIDDVVTTGSTLSECARVLRLSGAERVICATLACSRASFPDAEGEI